MAELKPRLLDLFCGAGGAARDRLTDGVLGTIGVRWVDKRVRELSDRQRSWLVALLEAAR